MPDEKKDEIASLLENDDIFKQLFGESNLADSKNADDKTDDSSKKSDDKKQEVKASEEAKEAEVKKADEVKPDAATDAGKPPEKTEPVKKKAAAKKAAQAPVVVDSEQIAEAAAKAAAKTVRELGKESEAKTAPDELTETIRKKSAVYEELERSDPKYKGIAKRLSDFERAEKARAEKWESQNQGESYDADAQEHKDWYAENEVRVDDDEFDEARIRVAARKIVQEEVNPLLNRQDREIHANQVKPLAKQAGALLTESVIRAFAPEGDITPETVKKIEAEDPEALEIAQQVNMRYRPVAEVIPLLYNGAIDRDDKNPVHQAALSILSQFEKELGEQENVSDDEGRTWVPMSEFSKMTKQQQQQHWIVSDEQIVQYIALTARKEAKESHKKVIERMEKLAERRGYKKADASDMTQKESVSSSASNGKAKEEQVKTTPSPSVGVTAVGDKSGKTDKEGSHILDPLFQFWK